MSCDFKHDLLRRIDDTLNNTVPLPHRITIERTNYRWPFSSSDTSSDTPLVLHDMTFDFGPLLCSISFSSETLGRPLQFPLPTLPVLIWAWVFSSIFLTNGVISYLGWKLYLALYSFSQDLSPKPYGFLLLVCGVDTRTTLWLSFGGATTRGTRVKVFSCGVRSRCKPSRRHCWMKNLSPIFYITVQNRPHIYFTDPMCQDVSQLDTSFSGGYSPRSSSEVRPNV